MSTIKQLITTGMRDNFIRLTYPPIIILLWGSSISIKQVLLPYHSLYILLLLILHGIQNAVNIVNIGISILIFGFWDKRQYMVNIKKEMSFLWSTVFVGSIKTININRKKQNVPQIGNYIISL